MAACITLQVRNNMVFPLLDAIEWFKPSYVVIEQVPVALSTDKRAYATTLQHQLLTLGYQVSHLSFLKPRIFSCLLLATSTGTDTSSVVCEACHTICRSLTIYCTMLRRLMCG